MSLLVNIIVTTFGETQDMNLKFYKVYAHTMNSSYGISSLPGRSVLDCGRRCVDEITCLGWSLMVTSNISSGVTCELRMHVTGNVSRDLVPNENYNHYCKYIHGIQFIIDISKRFKKHFFFFFFVKLVHIVATK